jgi:transcriptional regulator with XRE-family HTH domain
MRKAREAHGLTLKQWADLTGVDFTTLSRIENGHRAPSEALAAKCDEHFTEMRGWFMDFFVESQTWTQPSFRSWREYEDKARHIRAWQPGIVGGLLQTERYALAHIRTMIGVTDEMISSRLATRMSRQRRILLSEDAPEVMFAVDELCLFRYVGSPEIMVEQLDHLIEVASLPNVTVHVVPAVGHAGVSSEVIVTEAAGYVEHVIGGLVFTDDQSVNILSRLMTSMLSESYRASDSLAVIGRARALWSKVGASPVTQTQTAGRASKPRPATA